MAWTKQNNFCIDLWQIQFDLTLASYLTLHKLVCFLLNKLGFQLLYPTFIPMFLSAIHSSSNEEKLRRIQINVEEYGGKVDKEMGEREGAMGETAKTAQMRHYIWSLIPAQSSFLQRQRTETDSQMLKLKSPWMHHVIIRRMKAAKSSTLQR